MLSLFLGFLSFSVVWSCVCVIWNSMLFKRVINEISNRHMHYERRFEQVSCDIRLFKENCTHTFDSNASCIMLVSFKNIETNKSAEFLDIWIKFSVVFLKNFSYPAYHNVDELFRVRKKIGLKLNKGLLTSDTLFVRAGFSWMLHWFYLIKMIRQNKKCYQIEWYS